METQTNPHLRNNAFDFVRLLFAFFVVYAHSRYMYGAPDILHWEDSHFINLHAGSVGVWGFFALSGFLVTNSYFNSNGLTDFLTKRFKRIFPGFWCSLLVCALLFAPLWYFLRSNTLEGFLDINGIHIWKFLTSNLDATIQTQSIGTVAIDTVNGPYWTIRHEINCYIILGILLSITGNKPRLQKYSILLTAIFLSGVRLFYNYNPTFNTSYGNWFGDEHFLLFLIIFLWGSVLSIYRNAIKLNWTSALISLALLILATKFDFLPIVFPIAFTYLVISLCFSLPIHNVGKLIGDLSFGVYLYHWPVRLTLQMFGLKEKLDLWPFILLNTLCTLPLAYLSWNFVEKRFLRNRKENLAVKQSNAI